MSESNGTIETCESSRTSESIDCNCHSDSSDNSDSNDPECLFWHSDIGLTGKTKHCWLTHGNVKSYFQSKQSERKIFGQTKHE